MLPPFSPSHWTFTLTDTASGRQVTTLGLYFLPPSPTTDLFDSRLEQLKIWVNATEQALTLSEWSSKPQLRTIQTILLLTLYWRNTG